MKGGDLTTIKNYAWLMSYWKLFIMPLSCQQHSSEVNKWHVTCARSYLSILQEKQIYDLERRNQVLKKYKTVHTYKITELQKQVEAKDSHIEEKEKKLNVVSE